MGAPAHVARKERPAASEVVASHMACRIRAAHSHLAVREAHIGRWDSPGGAEAASYNEGPWFSFSCSSNRSLIGGSSYDFIVVEDISMATAVAISRCVGQVDAARLPPLERV